MVITPEKKRIATTFGLKASTYDANAPFQARLLRLLLPSIESVATKDGRWIDLGCGTGLLKALDRDGIIGCYTGLDIAFNPLTVLQKKPISRVSLIQGDIDHLPMKPGSFEGAVAASSLQWLDDLAAVLSEIASVLSENGHLAFSMFIDGAFAELFKTRSKFGLPQSIFCPGPDRLKELVTRAGFDFVNSETIEEKHFFPDALAVLRSISRMGGSATNGRKLTRRELEEFCRYYTDTFDNQNGVPLTYRAMVGLCKKRPLS
jgi:malonyl-ACP O-methyltransferase BioC